MGNIAEMVGKIDEAKEVASAASYWTRSLSMVIATFHRPQDLRPAGRRRVVRFSVRVRWVAGVISDRLLPDPSEISPALKPFRIASREPPVGV